MREKRKREAGGLSMCFRGGNGGPIAYERQRLHFSKGRGGKCLHSVSKCHFCISYNERYRIRSEMWRPT